MRRAIIILIIAFALTLTSAVMNISGYITLYSEASAIIAIIFIALELTKAAIFGIALTLATKTQKSLLVGFALFLLVISFLGHLSFLSRAYNINKSDLDNSTMMQETLTESHSTQTQIIDDQIATVKSQLESNNVELKTIQDNITAYRNDNKTNSANWVYTTNKKRIQEITNDNKELNQQLTDLYKQKQAVAQQRIDTTKQLTEVNSNIASRSAFIYTASIFNTTQDKLAQIINIVLSLAIDPLALIMLWTGTSLIQRKQDEKQQQQETQIIDTDNHYETIEQESITEQPEPKHIPPEQIDIYNAHKYTYQGYTLDDIMNLDTDTINNLKYTMKTKLAKEWLNACITIRNNKHFYHKQDVETKEIE